MSNKTTMKTEYESFVQTKLEYAAPVGISDVGDLPKSLFPHQSVLTTWALRRGRCAIFADTGLGKTRMEIAWADRVARHTGKPILVLSPLAVAPQIVEEGRIIGIKAKHCHEPSDLLDTGINVTNYDRLHKFDTSIFAGVVLDESSIIKHHDSKTLSLLIDAFCRTPFRLAATATPAPNDWTELGTHAEFLGICSRTEMLSEFFCHDGGETQTWRLKGHAKSAFWKWVVAWGALIRSPVDLGFDGSAYELPPLNYHEHLVDSFRPSEGMLFEMEARSLMERRQARRASIEDRVKECASVVNSTNDSWVVWCDLNDESRALCESIEGAVEITGSDETEVKEERLAKFARGEIKRLVSKPSICGFGLNWQHCSKMAFVGVTDSWEAYYQAVRRCWRFGQKRPVDVHVFASASEGSVVSNLKRKEQDALAMSQSLSEETLASVQESVLGTSKQTNLYNANNQIKLPSFL